MSFTEQTFTTYAQVYVEYKIVFLQMPIISLQGVTDVAKEAKARRGSFGKASSFGYPIKSASTEWSLRQEEALSETDMDSPVDEEEETSDSNAFSDQVLA